MEAVVISVVIAASGIGVGVWLRGELQKMQGWREAIKECKAVGGAV